jgi:hypothetical protein
MTPLRFLTICLLGASTLGMARAARIDAFTGGALFSPTSAVRSYYAQSKGGSKPLLQIYYFLNDTSHYLVQLRDDGSGAGEIEYQGYVDGKKLVGRGTYTISGGTFTARSVGAFLFTAKVRGSRILVTFKNSFGTYQAGARLHKFARIQGH